MSAVLEALRERARTSSRALLDTAGAPITAAALLEEVDRWCDALGAARVVATTLDNGPQWLAVDLAVRRRGGVHVPLPPYFSPGQRAHALASSGADALVSAPEAGASATGVLADARIQPLEPAPAQLPAGTACVTYTSGTTGAPKGVCLGADALEAVARSLVAATSALAPERHLCLLPLSTLLEQIGGLYAPILAGASIALPGLAEIGYSGAAGLDAGRLLACLRRYRPESVIVVPQILSAMVRAAEAGAELPGSLRFVAVGGARVGERLLARAAAVGLPVYEGYGLSECASVVCLNRPGANRPGSVGRALDHAQLRFGADGELFVGGVRMLGYVGEPPQAGEIATGDLARIDADGFVYLLGRRRDVFVTAYGRNVAPDWVESELAQHPAIAQAAVFGEARPTNVAVLVPAGANVADEALRHAVSEVNRELPDYARVDAYLRADEPFSLANGLATANGRVRRDRVRARYAAGLETLYAEPIID